VQQHPLSCAALGARPDGRDRPRRSGSTGRSASSPLPPAGQTAAELSRAESHHAEGREPGQQAAVGGRHRHPCAGGRVVAAPCDDLVVSRSWGVDRCDTIERARRHARPGLPFKHEHHHVERQLRACQRGVESRGRTSAVMPPAIRDRADDIRAVHNQDPHSSIIPPVRPRPASGMSG